MTNTAEILEALTTKKRPIWPFAILACLVALLWALIGSYDVWIAAPPPASDSVGIGRAIAYLAGTTMVPTVITWAIFYGLFFHRRTGTGKSLTVLSIMLVVVFSTLIGLHFRLIPLGISPAAFHWTHGTHARFEQHLIHLSALAPEAAIRPLFQNVDPAEVGAQLNETRRMRGIFARHVEQLAAEERTARQALADLAIDAETRTERVAWLNENWAADTPHRRLPIIMLRRLELRERMLEVLYQDRFGWTLRPDGVIQMFDQSLLTRIQVLNAQMAVEDRAFREALADAAAAEQPPPAEPAPS